MRTKFHPLPIKSIKDETSEAYTLSFENPDTEIFKYSAGQYLTLRLWIEAEEYRRAFSLSSSLYVDTDLQITIKRVPNGKVSNYIRDHLKQGDIIDVMPPMGGFRIDPVTDKQRHYILIGAGSGISPLMSMLKTVLYVEPLSKVSLWYGNRDETSIILYKQLENLKKKYKDRLYIYYSLTQPSPKWKGGKGRLDEQHIYDLILKLFMVDTYRKQYYICGPEGMMLAAQEAFARHAINPKDVHQEYYSAPLIDHPEDVEASQTEKVEDGITPSHPDIETQEVIVQLDGGLYRLTVQPTQTILDAALEDKLDPPYTCQVGICTSCRAKLIKGKVHMDESMGLSADEIEQGYILTCQAHPMSDDVRLEWE